MSDQWEKYVEQATEVLHQARFGPEVSLLEFGPELVAFERAEVRAVLAVIGPRIEEDTRERLVAAAARAVEREQAETSPASLHKPFPDDGVTYCGWHSGNGVVHEGCGEVWPCSAERRGRATFTEWEGDRR